MPRRTLAERLADKSAWTPRPGRGRPPKPVPDPMDEKRRASVELAGKGWTVPDLAGVLGLAERTISEWLAAAT